MAVDIYRPPSHPEHRQVFRQPEFAHKELRFLEHHQNKYLSPDWDDWHHGPLCINYGWSAHQ
jgi:hypothetical protein